ncbi:MAG: glutaredoxin family protein [Actinomycetota bacterium]|nr:NrdH-redoxin [Actinomycetota bacterium]
MADIKMYGTTWCGDCTRAKRFFDDNGIGYDWINIEEDGAAFEVVLERNQGKRVVPTIVFPDGSHLSEPTNRALAQKLGMAD